MALANFFKKSALAASQILSGYDRSQFESKLINSPIELAYDRNATQSFEGRSTLELTIRLLSRLYPQLVLTEIETIEDDTTKFLSNLSKSINPEIELGIGDCAPVVSLVVGKTKIERKTPKFYIGSENWIIKFSSHQPVGSGNYPNPLAAGAAACFGTANVFRTIFKDQLVNADNDVDFELSLVDFSITEKSPTTLSLDIGKLRIPDTTLVGLGAIGNGAMWALSKIPGLEGDISLVDPQDLELSNLQRYVLAEQEHVGKNKSDLSNDWLSATSLKTFPYSGDWASFVKNNKNWKVDTVLVAVDTINDRISIQGSLPKNIINAWTQPEDIGISRHFNFLEDACLACLYIGNKSSKSLSELYADSFSLPEEVQAIGELIYSNGVITKEWIEKIAGKKDIPLEILMSYVDLPISEFYRQVFCGEVLLGRDDNNLVETPMAFQSALAGILLASELFLYSVKGREDFSRKITKLNLLKPLSPYLNESVLKLHSKNYSCICQDEDFRLQYHRKYLEIPE